MATFSPVATTPYRLTDLTRVRDPWVDEERLIKPRREQRVIWGGRSRKVSLKEAFGCSLRDEQELAE